LNDGGTRQGPRKKGWECDRKLWSRQLRVPLVLSEMSQVVFQSRERS
jgi:hypothetical protein